jgi:hypothetical protein
MAEDQARSPFVAEWNALEAMLDDGEPFEQLEATIESSPFDEDERAALWLASWARASRGRDSWRLPEPPRARHLAAVD